MINLEKGLSAKQVHRMVTRVMNESNLGISNSIKLLIKEGLLPNKFNSMRSMYYKHKRKLESIEDSVSTDTEIANRDKEVYDPVDFDWDEFERQKEEADKNMSWYKKLKKFFRRIFSRGIDY